jgi:LPXTG-site transpeptidase (sortase) family protein
MMINNKKLFRLFLLRFVGNMIFSFSLALILKTFALPAYFEVKFFVDENLLKRKYFVVQEKVVDSAGEDGIYDASPQSQLSSFFKIGIDEKMTPVDTDYGIVIPRIAANSRIIANVDPKNEDLYLDALQNGVAHAEGTAMPGQGENVFLFAHSTDYVWNLGLYNAVFYLLYKLEKGDEVNVFYNGKRHIYIVSEKKIVNPDDVQYLINTRGRESLTLQTCWPPGTTAKRLLVFAEPK